MRCYAGVLISLASGPPCFSRMGVVWLSAFRHQAPRLSSGSKADGKRQAGDCSPNTNSTLNLDWLSMLYVNGLVDNDRLPPYNDWAIAHHYRLRLIDHVLGFR